MVVNSQERLPLLDVFRFFLCLMVIVFHGAIHKFYELPDNQILSHNLLTGAVYMDAFFILSGFLLFLLYGNRFDSISPSVSLKEFYLKRYIKIYAQYLPVVAVIMALDKEYIYIYSSSRDFGSSKFFSSDFRAFPVIIENFYAGEKLL